MLDTCSAGLFGGFTSLGIIAVILGNFSDLPAGDLKYFGVACLIGLAGPEQKLIVSMVWNSVLSKFQSGTLTPQQPSPPPEAPSPSPETSSPPPERGDQ